VRCNNFQIQNGIYFLTDDVELDIHNCYDFKKFEYNIEHRTVTLQWSSNKYAKANDPEELLLTMTGISVFEVHPRNSSIPFTEDDCLNSFGYDSDEDWADGQFWIDKAPEPDWYWSFLFQSEMEILVKGDYASLKIKWIFLLQSTYNLIR